MNILTLQKQSLFETDFDRNSGAFPQTRYQGSKYKLLNWIKSHLKNIDFETALDAFGGTGSVSYLMKQMGKKVIYNDYLKFNSIIATGLIENNKFLLRDDTINFILSNQNHSYPNFIENNFSDIYFTNDENQWLDRIIANIEQVDNKYEKSLAYFSLFQSCIAKRPYNLFHRKNLYVRTAEVERSFGNKKTWDTPFEEMFLKFAEQANGAVFDNRKDHVILNQDVLKVHIPKPDLVYIDSPYLSKKGTGVNYQDFYHFLEGIVNYSEWASKIDGNSKHKKLKSKKSLWDDKKTIVSAFEMLMHKFKDSILVISYRDDGIPSIQELSTMLEDRGKKISIYKADYKYALSNTNTHEVLIVAQ